MRLQSALSLGLTLLLGCHGRASTETTVPQTTGGHDVTGVEWVRLRREPCTGRRVLDEPKCAPSTLTIRSDGRVRADDEGATDAAVEGTIALQRAVAAIERGTRWVELLRHRQCGVDHTHYITIEIGHTHDTMRLKARGCGPRFQRAARSIERAARSWTPSS